MRIPLLILVLFLTSACAYDGQNTQTRVYTGTYYGGYYGRMDPFYNDPFYTGFSPFSPYPYYMRADWRATHMYPGYYHRHHPHYHGHRGHHGRR